MEIRFFLHGVIGGNPEKTAGWDVLCMNQ